MKSIRALILAQLAAAPAALSLGACAREPEAAKATASVTAPASASASASAPASASASASVAPSASVRVAVRDAGPSKRGASCWTSADCGAGMRCVLPFDGAHTIPGRPGTCHGVDEPMMGGRPLYVGGGPVVAGLAARADWRSTTPEAALDEAARVRWRELFARSSREEHASIASFARTICQLVALGAPSRLVEQTQRALHDEIVHARACFAWLSHLGGAELGPARFPEAVAPFAGFGAAEAVAADLLRDVVRGGCIGETLAASEAAELAASAEHPALAELFDGIAEDEARHAALAFETARWLLVAFPATRPVLDEELGAVARLRPAHRELVGRLVGEIFA